MADEEGVKACGGRVLRLSGGVAAADGAAAAHAGRRRAAAWARGRRLEGAAACLFIRRSWRRDIRHGGAGDKSGENVARGVKAKEKAGYVALG